MIKDFFSLLYPRTCVLCGQGLSKKEKLICLRCNFQLPRFIDHEETKSFLPNIMGAHTYSEMFAYIKYYKKGIGQKLLQKIKYDNTPELAVYIGYWLGIEIKNAGPELDLIIPVPLHKKKLRQRGYNQSDYFAKGISKGTGLLWSPKILFRIKNNPSQTNKSRTERLDNVEGIFRVKRPDSIHSKNILLVDDVITTGATLFACSKALTGAGAHVRGIASIALAK
jgi:ComF family protein